MLRFVRRTYRKKNLTLVLESREVHEATIVQVKLAHMHDDIKEINIELKDVDPCYGPRGQFRAQGRLKYIEKLGLETARPLILK